MPLWKVLLIAFGSLVFVGIISAGIYLVFREKKSPDTSFVGARGGEWTLEPYKIEGSSIAVGLEQTELAGVLTKGAIHLTTTRNDLPKGSDTLTWSLQGGVGDLTLSGSMTAMIEVDGRVEGNTLRFIPSAKGLGCDVKMNAGDIKAGIDCASMISNVKTTYGAVAIEIKDNAEATGTVKPTETWTNVWHWRLRKLNDIDTGPSAKKGETNCPQTIPAPNEELKQLLSDSISAGDEDTKTLEKMKNLTNEKFFQNKLVKYKDVCYEVYGAYVELKTLIGGVEEILSDDIEKRDNKKEKYYVTENVNQMVDKNGQKINYNYKGTILIYLTKL